VRCVIALLVLTVATEVLAAGVAPSAALAQARPRALTISFEAVPETRFFLLAPIPHGLRIFHICDAPCEHRMTRGTHRIGVDFPGRELTSDVVPLVEDGTLSARLIDREPIRVIGWTLFGVSIASAIVAVLSPAFDDHRVVFDEETRSILFGTAAFLVQLGVVGLLLGLQPDGVAFRFE
jgi:hypothetical protein